MLDSKIVMWLEELSDKHSSFKFAFCTAFRRRAFVLKVYDRTRNDLISAIYVNEQTVLKDDLEEFKKIVVPCLPFTIIDLTDEQIENIQDEVVHKSDAELWDELE